MSLSPFLLLQRKIFRFSYKCKFGGGEYIMAWDKIRPVGVTKTRSGSDARLYAVSQGTKCFIFHHGNIVTPWPGYAKYQTSKSTVLHSDIDMLKRSMDRTCHKADPDPSGSGLNPNCKELISTGFTLFSSVVVQYFVTSLNWPVWSLSLCLKYVINLSYSWFSLHFPGEILG
jgi:hypothetical protein